MAVRICTRCGEGNKEQAKICIACGHSLKDAPLTGMLDSEKGYALGGGARGRRLCSNCSEELEDGALKCKYCGSAVVEDTKPSYMPSVESDSLLWPKILVVIATCIMPFVGMIVGGVKAFQEDKDDQLAGGFLVGLGLVMVFVHFFIGRMLGQ